jgi:DNA polymerase III delta prime subunit
LADKLRPRTLAEVVGQEHLLGRDGALTRLLDSRSLGSLIFWGPPGTGKTTVARLLAHATDLHFEQISAIFSGVGDLKKVTDAAPTGARSGAHAAVCRGIHRFNRAQRDPFCRSWRTAPSCWSVHDREPFLRAASAAPLPRPRARFQSPSTRPRSKACSAARVDRRRSFLDPTPADR